MTFFDDEPTGPLFHMMGGDDFSDPRCEAARNGCDPILGLSFARYTGAQPLVNGVEYAARTICHGLRPATPEEVATAQLFGKEVSTVCDIEIQYIRD